MGEFMKRSYLFIIVFLLLALPASAKKHKSLEEKILYEKNSLYQYIVVSEDMEKKERYIYNTKRDYMQGGISVTDPDRLIFEYYRLSFISLAFLDREPEDVLFVGLGAGSMPRYFCRYYPEAKVDVVELDPDILAVAKRHFLFEETGNMKVHVSDGRTFIKRSKKEYDLISLDAYQTDYIPFHLTTVEFLREVKKRLKKGGVVVSNVVTREDTEYFHAMIETYKQVFPHLYIYKGSKSANLIFIATDSPKEKKAKAISRRARKLQEEKNFDIDLPRQNWHYGYYTDFEGRRAKVLTDDYAPVNLMRHMKAREK
jgi:spermidine synthase